MKTLGELVFLAMSNQLPRSGGSWRAPRRALSPLLGWPGWAVGQTAPSRPLQAGSRRQKGRRRTSEFSTISVLSKMKRISLMSKLQMSNSGLLSKIDDPFLDMAFSRQARTKHRPRDPATRHAGRGQRRRKRQRHGRG